MRRALLVGLVVSLSGCALFQIIGGFEKPSLSFKTARVTDVALDAVTLDTVWAVENTNPVTVKVAKADCAVFVEDRQLEVHPPPAGFVIKAATTTELAFPARVKLKDIASVALKDTVRYRLKCALTLDTSIGPLDYPLEYAGEAEVPKVPQVTFQPPVLTKGGLDFVVDLTNKNDYPLPLAGLSGQVSLGGQSVGTVSTSDIGTLEPKGTRRVHMPLTVNLLAAAGGLQSLLSGQKVPLTFNAALLSGGERIPLDVNQLLELAH